LTPSSLTDPFKPWNNTDIGNTLHKDIGYTFADHWVVRVEVKVRCRCAQSSASRRPFP